MAKTVRRGVLAVVLTVGAALVPAIPLAGGSDSGPGARDAAKRAPVVRQMVVFRDGRAVTSSRVSTRGLLARVRGKRCAVPAGTALAALLRDPPARVRLRDFGACTRRPRDSGQLFVRAIGPDRNRGRDGWVYKVGRRAATAGAADPSGAFGAGRLRSGQRVTWFYCRLVAGGCQRTLSLKAGAQPGGVAVTVTGYDDEGRGVRVAGATVRLGSAEQVTDASGVARFAADPGTYAAFAERDGLVRSHTDRVTVR